MADSEEYLIKVTGFSPDTKEPAFRLFFSNPKYSGVKYGNIIKLIVEENVAYILFEHAEDAEVVKNHSPYTWAGGAKIYCTYANRDGASVSSKPKPSPTPRKPGTPANNGTVKSPNMDSKSINSSRAGQSESHRPFSTTSYSSGMSSPTHKPSTSTKVVVTGFGKSHKQTVELYFQQQEFRPDDVENIDMSLFDMGYVFITYKTETAAEVLLKHTNLQMEDSSLTAKLYSNMPMYVELTGFADNTHTQTLELFLKQKQLGGDEIENINLDDLDIGHVVVKYTSFDAAQKLLKTTPLELLDSPLQAKLLQQSDIECRQVLIRGFKKVPHSQTMELYLHSEDKNKQIEAIDMTAIKDGRVFVKFKSQTGAEDYSKQTLVLEEQTLQTKLMTRRDILQPRQEQGARPKEPSTKKKTKKKHHHTDDEEEGDPSSDDSDTEELSKTVVIEGLPPGIHKQDIELTIDTPQMGGPDIVDWNWDWLKDYGVVGITYKKQTVAESLSRKKSLDISGTQVKLYSASTLVGYHRQRSLTTRAVKAVYDKDNIKVGVVELYFKSKKRGGGEIQDLCHDLKHKILYITYEDKSIAQSIATKKKHTVDECLLTVTIMKASPPSHKVKPPFEDNYLLVLYLPREVTFDELKEFLSADNGDKPKCFFSATQGVALVKYKHEPEFSMLLAKCQEVPFKGRMINLQRVPKVKCLQVMEIEGIGQQEIELYFDNKSDEKVTDVKIHKKPKLHAVVEFEEPEVAQQVLDKQPFIYCGKTFAAELYFKGCGLILTKVSESSPWSPDDVLVQGIKLEVLQFVYANSKLKGSIEKQIKEVNAQVVWPLGNDTEVVLKYVENNSIPIDGWKKCATDTFCAEMQQLTTKTVQVLEMAWADVQKKAKPLLNINTENEVVRVDSRSYLIIVTGLRDTVTKTVEKIQGIVNEIEAEIERLKQVIREDMAIQRQYQIELLKEIPKFQAMLQNGKVTIDIARDNKNISLKGLPNDIKKTKLAIYEILKEIETHSIPFKPEKMRFFQRQNIRDYVSDTFKKRGLLLQFEINKTQASLHGENKNTIEAGLAAMRDAVKTETIKVIDEQKDVPQSENWKWFVTSKFDNNPCVMLGYNHGNIHVIATKDKIEQAVKDIKEFLKKNAVTEQSKTVTHGQLRLILNHHSDRLNDIKEKVKDPGYHLKTAEGCTFVICGPIDAVNKARQMLDSMIQDIHKKEHTFDSPGMSQFFTCSEGELILNGLETKYKVCIDVKGGATTQGYGIRWKASVDGVEIVVVKGDLTKCKYDVLVNAANERLGHYATLAKDFVDKGGREIQRESDEYIKKKGELQVSGNAVTTGGKLACKKVVHAVGPRYNTTHKGGVDKKAEGLLYDTVNNVLDTSRKLHAETIGLPIISTGMFGFPFDHATETTLNAIKQFVSKHTGAFKQIALVHNDNTKIRDIISAVKRAAGGEPVGDGGSSSTPHRHSRSPRASSKYNDAPRDAPGSGSRKFTTQNGISVDLKVGELAKEQVDVIVSSGSTDLKLHTGNLSKSLLQAAGSKLQDECNKIAPKGVKPGDLVVTSGANLPCKQVYHGACVKWEGDGEKAKQVLAQYIGKCLVEANKAGHKSMAIPSIGTGNLRMPSGVVAKLTIDEIVSFKPKSLKHIDIVIYHKDRESDKAFASEISRQSGDRERKMAPRAGKHYSHDSGGDKLRTGSGITISVRKGELANEKCDVVVVSVTEDCQMKRGALSKSILYAGGNRIQEDLDKQANGFRLEAGKVLVTKAGRLSCNYLYHGTCLNYDGPGKRSEQALVKFVRKCLEMALNYKVKSITFPALGTGGYKIPHDTVAQIMFDEVKRIRDAKTLKYVNFVIYPQDDKSYTAFMSMLSGDGGGDDGYYEGSGEADYEMVEEDEDAGDDDSPSGSGQNSVFTGADISGGILTITSSNLVIEVQEGNLTEVDADAIVNGTYGGRLLGGAVGKALGQAGGRTFKDDCERKEKFKKSSIVTTGGNMPCRHVLHIDISKNNKSSTGWRETVIICLEEAEKQGWSSIAFPAFGTGKSGQSPEQMAVVFMDAFKQFITSGDNKNLGTAKLVVFEPECFKTMQKEMKKKALEADGAVAKIKGAIGGVISKGWDMIASVTAGHTPKPVPRAKPQYSGRPYQGTKKSSSITFEFHSFSSHAIDDVIKDLNSTCRSKTTEITLDSPDDQEWISQLTPPHVQEIKALQLELNVIITIDQGRNKSIKIYGWHADALQVKERIRDIFRELDEEKLAKVIHGQVKWQYEEAGKFKDYPAQINTLIEKKHNDGKPTASWKEEEENGEEVQYVIDFKKMVETKAGRKRETKVQRFKPGEHLSLPSTWTPMSKDDSCITVKVDPNSQEYAEAVKLFNTQTGSALKIVQLDRIQNPSLYQKVMTHEKYMKCANQKSRKLFHGTSLDTITKINTNGFNRSYCGKNATAVGKGVYFATGAPYSASDTYSRPDANGNKYMYICTVLTGDYTGGNSSLIDAPPKDASNPHILYDSVVNDVKNPGMFIVFSDTQAYPDYLITFKR